MTHWVEAHKPAAGVSTHLMLATMMWIGVGSALIIFGSRWLWGAAPTVAPWLAAGAVGLGWIKSRLVLDRAARRVVERIRARGDGRCLGGFLSLGTWAQVVLMVVVGRLLRGTLARSVIGPIYIAVGTALCLSARVTLDAWFDARRSG